MNSIDRIKARILRKGLRKARREWLEKGSCAGWCGWAGTGKTQTYEDHTSWVCNDETVNERIRSLNYQLIEVYHSTRDAVARDLAGKAIMGDRQYSGPERIPNRQEQFKYSLTRLLLCQRPVLTVLASAAALGGLAYVLAEYLQK